jgi:hypothetical protein
LRKFDNTRQKVAMTGSPEILLIVEEACSLDIVRAELVSTVEPLDCPRIFTVEALCPSRADLEGFTVLPANAALINLQALLSNLLRKGLQSIELVPTSPSFAWELCTRLLSERTSVRAKEHLPRSKPDRTLPYRIKNALRIRKNLELSNGTEVLRVNEWVPARYGATALAIAGVLDRSVSFRVDISQLIRPSLWPDEGRYLSAAAHDISSPASALAARSKELFLSSFSTPDSALALRVQYEAAVMLFKAYELFSKDGLPAYEAFKLLEKLWMCGWFDSQAAGHALDHLAGLWVDVPSYRDQHYALLVLRIEDASAGTIPPFINYLPKADEVSKLIARAFAAEVFIDSRSQSAYNYIGHQPRDQVVHIFQLLEYSVDERNGKPLRDPPPDRTVTQRPPFRPGPFNFVCSLRFPDKEKALAALQSVQRGSAGALEKTILTFLNTTLGGWNAGLKLESVQILPFTGLGGGQWPLAWGWPRRVTEAGLGQV